MSEVRPWVSRREERRQYPEAWWALVPGSVVRCPDCDFFLTNLGVALSLEIRMHPGGKLAKPSDPLGLAPNCPGCGLRLDLRFPAVGGGAAAA